MRNNYFRVKKYKGSDSKTEHNRLLELRLLERAGAIKNLQTQVSFELQPSFKTNQGKIIRKMEYTTDFVYYDCTLRAMVAEESKGFKTESYRMRSKLFQFKYPEYIFIETGLKKKKAKKRK